MNNQGQILTCTKVLKSHQSRGTHPYRPYSSLGRRGVRELFLLKGGRDGAIASVYLTLGDIHELTLDELLTDGRDMVDE